MDAEKGDRVEEGSRGGERTDGKREEKATLNGDCFIDVKEGTDQGGVERSRNSEKSKGEKVCRICHSGKELIPLGCDCKGELGSSHRHCAEAWFTQKGDRLCEICRKTAKNISNNVEETSIFMMELSEMREVADSLEASGETTHRCKQCFCHMVLACFILLFMLLWFFRGISVL